MESYAESRKRRDIFHYTLTRRSETVADFIGKTQLPENAHVLDVGTADGLMLEILNQIFPNFSLDGLERSPELVKLCKQKGFNAVQGDARDLPFSDHSYDAVLIAATLKHIPQYQKVVQEFKRVLIPNGYLIVVDPTPLALWMGIYRGHFETKYLPNIWSLKETSRRISAEGFEIIAKQKYMLFPFYFPGSRAIEIFLKKCSITGTFLHQGILAKNRS